MDDSGNLGRNLRERLGSGAEDRLGRALGELLENPLLTGAIGRAFDAREKAVQAQEAAMGALNIPSAADIERLTRRLRSVSQRLEGIEDGVERLDRAIGPSAADLAALEARLATIEAQLATLIERIDALASAPADEPARASAAAPGGGSGKAGKQRKRSAKKAGSEKTSAGAGA
jgi:hypothetical protein